MKQRKNTTMVVSTLLGKARSEAKQVLAFGLLSLLGLGLMAQNSSYNANTIPIVGTDNAAFGAVALSTLTTGSNNVGIGKRALQLNTTGSENVAVGVNALAVNTTNSGITAIGYKALAANVEVNNTAVGHLALVVSTQGKNNTAVGERSMQANLTGTQNAALGALTMGTNTTGSNNTALGFLSNVSLNNFNNATALGSSSVVNASNKVRIGNSTVTVIEGQVAYTWPSDARFKFNVTEEVKGLDFINKLRPVVYNFDTRKFQQFLVQNMPEADRAAYLQADFGPSTAVRQSGFLAQEVEQVAKEVGYDFNGIHVPVDANDNYSLAYAEFVVPLVKAVQEQQQLIVAQDQANAAQQQQIEVLQKQVAALLAAQSGAAGEAKAVNGVKMYPNPSGGIVTINTLPMDAAAVEVYDMAGTRVYQAALKAGTTTHLIDLSAYPRGMYTVKVSALSQEVSTQKVVLQ
jgi:trimeric autotransporter adhesin